MRSSTRIRVAGTAATAIALVVLTACSSSSKTSPTSKSSAGAESPIKIGSIGSYSGVESATSAKARTVLESWAKDVNTHGGINGHMIDLIVKDDAGNASTALTAARELVQQDKVVAIVGDDSTVDAAWASVVDAAGIPVIGGFSGQVVMEKDPNFFPTGTTVLGQAYGVLANAQKLGGKYALMYCAEAPICAQSVPLVKVFASAQGGSVVLAEAVSASAPNYTAVCQAVISSGATTYQVAQIGPIALRIADACVSQGVKATMLQAAGVASSDWLTHPSVNGEQNVEVDAPFFTSSTPGMKAYNALLAKYNLGNGGEGNGVQLYAGAKLFEAAVGAVGKAPVTSKSLKTALWSMKSQTLDGLTPPLTYTQDKPTSVNCYFTSGIKEGKWILPNGMTTACAPDAVISPIAAHL